jgi:hypothetical protein
MSQPTVEQMRSEFHSIRQSPSKIEDWARKHVPGLLTRLEKAEAASIDTMNLGAVIAWLRKHGIEPHGYTLSNPRERHPDLGPIHMEGILKGLPNTTPSPLDEPTKFVDVKYPPQEHWLDTTSHE